HSLLQKMFEVMCTVWEEGHKSVTLLNFWKPPTAAQHTIESVPPNAVVGKDAILFVTNLPENLLGYVWYTGDRVEPKLQILSYVIDSSEITPWPRYNGQEKIYPDGSLLFQNATQEDTGYYTLQVLKRTLPYEVGTGQLHVYPDHPPTTAHLNIELVPPNTVVGKDVILLVTDLPENLVGYVWYKGDRVQHIRNILGPGYNGREKTEPDGSLLFQNTTQEDTGYHTLQGLKRTLLYEVGTRQLHIHRQSFLSDRWVSVGVNSTSHKQD
uniref:Immunoglobulin V-set domain-containing protein n=1 Tax=Equus caballus TaxID=9796 RepID=A0A3Q2HVD6_HORSE